MGMDKCLSLVYLCLVTVSAIVYGSFSAYKAYGQSKTGDILLAKEFGEQLKVSLHVSVLRALTPLNIL